MNLIQFLLRASPRTVWLAIAAAVIGGLSTAGVLAFIRWWMLDSDRGSPALVWAFAGVCIGAVVSKLIAQVMLVGLSRRSVSKLLMHLSRGVLAAPLQNLERVGTAHLHLVLTADVQAVVQGLSSLPLICANAAIIASCLGFLGYLSMPVMLTVLAALSVGLFVQTVLMRQAQALIGRTRDGQETVAQQLQHLLEGVKEMKSHRPRREAFLEEVLQGCVSDQEKLGAASQHFMALADAAGRVVLFALIGFLVLGLAHLEDPRPGALSSYLLIVFFLMQPLSSIKYLLPQLTRAKLAMQKVQALGLDLTTNKEAATEGKVELPGTIAKLELDGVTYSYPTGPDESAFKLGPIDFTLQPGEVVFLGGGNGSGKTTFAKLLIGLYAPKKGDIRVDGQPVTTESRESYRQLFSAVFAEFHLLPGLMGLPGENLPERAKAMLAKMRLDDKVALLQEGTFSTTTRLSRGQKKRLALLVALLEDRPYYVFDEWAADQDPHFRNIFYTQLLPELKVAGKGVLVITHDERYFLLADRLLLLDEGKLKHVEATS